MSGNVMNDILSELRRTNTASIIICNNRNNDKNLIIAFDYMHHIISKTHIPIDSDIDSMDSIESVRELCNIPSKYIRINIISNIGTILRTYEETLSLVISRENPNLNLNYEMNRIDVSNKDYVIKLYQMGHSTTKISEMINMSVSDTNIIINRFLLDPYITKKSSKHNISKVLKVSSSKVNNRLDILYPSSKSISKVYSIKEILFAEDLSIEAKMDMLNIKSINTFTKFFDIGIYLNLKEAAK